VSIWSYESTKGSLPGARARAAAVDVQALGVRANRDLVRTSELDVLNDDTRARSATSRVSASDNWETKGDEPKGARVALVNEDAVFGNTSDGVAVVRDTVDGRVRGCGLSLDAQAVDRAGHGITGDNYVGDGRVAVD
jgi:hypothetical protein